MAKIVGVYGSNVFLFATISGTNRMIGCSKGFDTDTTGTPIDISCAEDGMNKSFIPATQLETNVSFDGISKTYTSTDATTAAAIDDFFAALGAGTEMTVFYGAAITTGSVVQKGTLIVSSCKKSYKLGAEGTYNVSGKVSKGWSSFTIV